MKKQIFFKKESTKKLVISGQHRNSLGRIPIVAKNKKSDFTQEISKGIPKSKQKVALDKIAQQTIILKKVQLVSNDSVNQEGSNLQFYKKKQNEVKLPSNRKILRSKSEIQPKCVQVDKNQKVQPFVKLQNSQFEAQVKQIHKVTTYSLMSVQNSASKIAQSHNIELLTQILQNLSQNQVLNNSLRCKQSLELVCKRILNNMQAPTAIDKNNNQNLKFHSVSQQTIFPENPQVKKIFLKNNVSRLLVENQKLQQKVSLHHLQLHNLNQICKQKQRQLIQSQKKANQLQETIMKQKLTVEIITKQLEQKQGQGSLNSQFCGDPTRQKILHWVSQAYKKIQAEIYDYACFLQCNSMASSLNWEPKPFRAVQNWVYEQMERVNTYIASKAESVEDKAARMREFVTNTTRKFKSKDQEMTKVTDFKTECIKKFTGMMHKWLENWELKQYLPVQSEEIDCLLLELETQAPSIGGEMEANNIQSLLGSLKKVWNKVELNYKYGNSFY